MTRSALIALLSLLACFRTSAAGNATSCEARYEITLAESGLRGPQQRAEYLERTAPSCLGTGMFDVWIAADYLSARKFDDAVRVAQRALTKTRDARPNLIHVLVRADLARGDTAKALQRAQTLIADHPRYAPIQFELAGIATRQQDWHRALAHARKAYEIEGSALSLLSMAAALHQLDRHEEAVTAVRQALELEPQRIANIGGIGEAIFSLAMLGRRSEARELAARHIDANPNWRANQQFARAAVELGVGQ
jgi:tetratricopeptide (TPR) repeat protein